MDATARRRCARGIDKLARGSGRAGVRWPSDRRAQAAGWSRAASRLWETAQEGFRCLLVAPRLDEEVEDDPLLVHRPPEPVLLPLALQLHLVAVPRVAWSGTAPPHPVGEGLPDLPAPPTDGLVADLDPALGQQFLHVAIAEQEPGGQPHRVANELAGEAMPLREGRWLKHRRGLRDAPTGTPFSCCDNPRCGGRSSPGRAGPGCAVCRPSSGSSPSALSVPSDGGRPRAPTSAGRISPLRRWPVLPVH
jgi:hypothetical protein